MAKLSGDEAIVLVASVDDGYVMPLAVMVRSVLENLRPGVGVRLFVFDNGTQPASRLRAEDSWAGFPIACEWITPDARLLEGCVQDRGYAGVPATYCRLLLAEMLPPDVRKAIYLDADMIVDGDLYPLWEQALSGHLALAVPDAYFELYHRDRFASIAFRDEDRPTTFERYFNAGVLVVDVDAWRREDIGRQALTIARRYKEALTFHDQDALNCVLSGRWGALAPTWNFHELFDALMFWDRRRYRGSEIEDAFGAPRIVHFIGPTKPWARGCANVHAPKFAEYYARTSWGEEPLPTAGALDRLAQEHGRLNWLLWRRVADERSAGRWPSIRAILARRPWMLLTYPAWQATLWAYLTTSWAWSWIRRRIRPKSPGNVEALAQP